jgi:hypothetical protein
MQNLKNADQNPSENPWINIDQLVEWPHLISLIAREAE